MKWGEDKVIFEEAIAGALAAMASTATALSPFVGQAEVANIASGNLGLLEAVQASSVLLAGVAGFVLMGWQKTEWHYDGMRHIDDPKVGRLTMQLNENKLMSARQQKHEVRGFEIGGVELSRTREVGHTLIGGLPGSGKTVIINNLLHQAMLRGDRAIIHSPKGDFEAWMYDPDDSVLLGPWDARASCWDIARDIKTPELATSFAEAMVLGSSDGGGSGGNKFFEDAAREVIAGLIKYFMRKRGEEWSWDDLAEALSKGGQALIDKAQLGDPNIRNLIPKPNPAKPSNNTTDNIIASVSAAVSWVLAYSSAFVIKRNADGSIDRENTRMFSIQDWLAKRDHQNVKKVFLNNNKNYEARGRQIFGAIAASAANYINSSEMPEISADVPGLLVCLDEYPQLGKGVSKYVIQIEELGRSRGVRVWKAIQDNSQTTAQLGREMGAVQTAMQQTRIFCKMSIGTASEISKELGEFEQMRIEFPIAVGAGNKRTVKERVPVLNVADLTGLKVFKEQDLNGKPVGPQGVEILVQTDDLVTKLFQPFISGDLIKERHEKFVPSIGWERGILIIAERVEQSMLSPADKADIAHVLNKQKIADDLKARFEKARAEARAKKTEPGGDAYDLSMFDEEA